MIRMGVVVVLVGWALTSLSANACSAFAANTADFRLFAKSYDWYMSHGLAVINKRNVEKTSLTMPGDRPVQWVSKYGSLSYTQFGRDFPVSGINEKGLAVEILWDFDFTDPIDQPELPAINEVQWIQYQLDVSATVQEAIANSKKVKIKKIEAPIHYLVCDAGGECVVFEFAEGRMWIRDANTRQVLTNSSYPAALTYLQDHLGFGGKKAIPYGSYNSRDRFVILNSEMGNLLSRSMSEAVDYSFQMLQAVRKPGYTVWQMVHDLKNQVSHFRRMFEEKITRVIDLKRFNLSCQSPVKILDLESEDHGDASAEFSDYDPEVNRAIVELGGQGLGVNQALIDAVARYPETTRCLESGGAQP